MKADPSLLEQFVFPDDDDSDVSAPGTVDLDKAWHGIQFLLNAVASDDTSPLSWSVPGGAEAGDDWGNGPPRILAPCEVSQIAEALSAVSREQLRHAFDAAAMSAAGIYPNIWERDPQDALDYLLHCFPTLVSFYGEAAKNGQGDVIYIA